MVVESKFMIDVEEFFQVFFSNDATGFLTEFHRKCGDEILNFQGKEAQVDCAIAKGDNKGQHTTNRQILARNYEREMP
jgi:hypothetical protein